MAKPKQMDLPLYEGVITITGHRPPKLGGYMNAGKPNPVAEGVKKQILTDLEAKLKELKPKLIYTGMGLGVPQWAAQLCIDMNIPFVAAIPHLGHEGKWPQESINIYNALLQKASEKIIVTQKTFFPGAMHIRNKWMVDRSGRVLAVFDGTPGDTSNCVSYAKSINKTVDTIPVPAHTQYIPKPKVNKDYVTAMAKKADALKPLSDAVVAEIAMAEDAAFLEMIMKVADSGTVSKTEILKSLDLPDPPVKKEVEEKKFGEAKQGLAFTRVLDID